MRARPSKLLVSQPAPEASTEAVRRPAPTFGAGGTSVSDFLGSFSPKRAAPGTSGKMRPIEVAVANAKTRSRTGEWDDADAATFVGLYAHMHELIYRVLPAELEGKNDFAQARNMARRCLDSFGGNPHVMVEFMKWSWKRERERAEWAAANGRARNRMTWRWQWAPGHVTDWRADAQAKRILRKQ